jgi:hypothetical protein
MSYEIRSRDLQEIHDTGIEIMREGRNRTADLKQGRIALEGAHAAIKARREDLLERLNAGKLVDIETRMIQGQSKSQKTIEDNKDAAA